MANTAAKLSWFAMCKPNVLSHGSLSKKYFQNEQFVFQGCSKSHQSLKCASADILSAPADRSKTQQTGASRGENSERKLEKTDTGIRYKLENIRYLIREETG